MLLENGGVEGVRDGGEDTGAIARVVVARARSTMVQSTG